MDECKPLLQGPPETEEILRKLDVELAMQARKRYAEWKRMHITGRQPRQGMEHALTSYTRSTPP